MSGGTLLAPEVAPRGDWQASRLRSWNTDGQILVPFATVYGLIIEVGAHATQHTFNGGEQFLTLPSRPSCPTTLGACHIMKLPDELLVMMLEYLVPRGMTFHIFPHDVFEFKKGKTIVRESTAIHCFGKPVSGRWLEDERLSRTGLTATSVSAVCRRLRDLYTPIMYGSNRWVVEMSMDSLNPTTIGSVADRAKLASWTRLFDVRSLNLWPLTAHTVKYVTELFLLIDVRESYGYHEVHCLAGHLRRAVALLGSNHGLNRLAVDLRTTRRWINDRSKGVLQFPRSPPRLQWVVNEAGAYEMSLNDGSARPDLPEESIDVIWDALRPLRGVKNVHLSGVGSEERAEALIVALQSLAEPDDNVEEQHDTVEDRSEKRRQVR